LTVHYRVNPGVGAPSCSSRFHCDILRVSGLTLTKDSTDMET
jgi:hypothetical protein